MLNKASDNVYESEDKILNIGQCFIILIYCKTQKLKDFGKEVYSSFDKFIITCLV